MLVILYQLWNFQGQRPSAREIWESKKVDFVWVKTTVLFFTVCGPKFAKFGRHVQERRQFATPFSDRWYLVPIQRHSRSSREVFRNRAEILVLWGRQIFVWRGHTNFWPSFINMGNCRTCGKVWWRSAERSPRLGGEKNASTCVAVQPRIARSTTRVRPAAKHTGLYGQLSLPGGLKNWVRV